MLGHLAPIRDKLLELAGPLDGATLLDVGTGDGLIGLGGAGRGRGGDLLRRLARAAEPASPSWRTGARCVLARAEDLAGIEDASVDVVTARSVLIYVDDKAAAFAAHCIACCARAAGSRCSSPSTG